MKKIAIIEDDVTILEMYKMKFELSGFKVATASNGVEGLDMIEQFNPDIILLDLMMPEMTGDQMLTELRKKAWGKDVKVIVLTNVSKDEIPHHIWKLDISDYIIKASATPQMVVDHAQTTLKGL